MFHPLLDNLPSLTDQQLEQKLAELYQRYANIPLVGNPDIRRQLTLFIETYRNEMLRRTNDKQAAQKRSGPDPFASLDIQ